MAPKLIQIGRASKTPLNQDVIYIFDGNSNEIERRHTPTESGMAICTLSVPHEKGLD